MTGYDLDEKNSEIDLFSNKYIPELIKKGDYIELKHDSASNNINTNVLAVDENSIVLQIRDKFMESSFSKLDSITMNFSSLDELYVISGEIESVKALNSLEIKAKIHKIDRKENMREIERYSVNLIAGIHINGSHENNIVKVINLSLCGAKISCNNDLNAGDIVDMAISVAKSRKVNFRGEVVRKNSVEHHFEYGIEILDISKSNLVYLYQYIIS